MPDTSPLTDERIKGLGPLALPENDLVGIAIDIAFGTCSSAEEREGQKSDE